MADKNILMQEFNRSGYDNLYPQIIPSFNQDVNLNSNRIINLASPQNNTDAVNKQYVDEKIGTWVTLFEKEDIWSDSVSKARHEKDIYSSGTLDMSPLIQSKECKITLELFGTVTVVNNASYSQAITVGYTGFPYADAIELAYFTSGTSQLNVDGFQDIKIFNHKKYSLNTTSGGNPRVSLYNEINFSEAIGCNEFYTNFDSIELVVAVISGTQSFNFTNLHYKLKMEYKN